MEDIEHSREIYKSLLGEKLKKITAILFMIIMIIITIRGSKK